MLPLRLADELLLSTWMSTEPDPMPWSTLVTRIHGEPGFVFQAQPAAEAVTVTGVIPPAAVVFSDGGESVNAHAEPNCVTVCVNP